MFVVHSVNQSVTFVLTENVDAMPDMIGIGMLEWIPVDIGMFMVEKPNLGTEVMAL